MLKDMQYIFQAIEEKLASMELMQECYKKTCEDKEKEIEVKETQLQEAGKRIAELELELKICREKV